MGGNDDCGQMSAWYIFSALGFYPFAPGATYYCLTSPLVKKATLQLDNGKTLQISAPENSSKNIYIQRVFFNTKRLTSPFIEHEQLLMGGSLVFEMGPRPNKNAFQNK